MASLYDGGLLNQSVMSCFLPSRNLKSRRRQIYLVFTGSGGDQTLECDTGPHRPNRRAFAEPGRPSLAFEKCSAYFVLLHMDFHACIFLISDS
jgi:hypothetical protein